MIRTPAVRPPSPGRATFNRSSWAVQLLRILGGMHADDGATGTSPGPQGEGARTVAHRLLPLGGRQEVGDGASPGIMLMGFVLVHMVGNLKMYQGAARPQRLRRVPPRAPRTRSCPARSFLWIVRLGLIAAFVVPHPRGLQPHPHEPAGRRRRLRQTRDYQAANVASRSMRCTGVIILLYLVFHLADLTWGWVNPDFVRGDVYRNVQASLEQRPGGRHLHRRQHRPRHPPVPRRRGRCSRASGSTTPSTTAGAAASPSASPLIVTVGNLSFPLAVVSGLAGDDDCVERRRPDRDLRDRRPRERRAHRRADELEETTDEASCPSDEQTSNE